MTTGNVLYLCLVVAAIYGYALVLAAVTWYERSAARHANAKH